MRIYFVSPTHYDADGTLHKTTRYWTSGITLPYLKAITPPGHDVHVRRRAHARRRPRPRVRRRRHHRDGAADRARLRSRRPVPRPRPPRRARRHLGDAHRRGVAAARRRRRRRRGRGRLAARCSPTSREGRSRGIYRAARLARPRRPADDRLRARCRCSSATRSAQLALPHVLPLAGRLLARLPASLRVLRRPDLLPAQLPHPAGRRRHRGSARASRRSAAIASSSSTTTRSRTRTTAKELFRAMIPLGLKWASPVDDQHRARPRAARPRGAQRLRQPVDRPREHQRGKPRTASARTSIRRAASARTSPRIRAKGIQVIALLMVGLDGDTPDTFGRTLQFLLDSKISFLKLFTPCPYPGTKYYDDMREAGPHPRRRLGALRLRHRRSSSRPA